MDTRQNWAASTVLIMSLLLAGCSLMRKSESSSPGTGKQAGPTKTAAFKPSNDARQDLGDALKKLKTPYPYRVTETVSATMNEQPATQATNRVAEFAAPDRSRVKLSGEGGQDMEMISIGEKDYTYADGKWTESAGTSAAQKAKIGTDMEKMLSSALKDVQSAGSETVNGVPCFVYTYRLELPTFGKDAVGTGKAWIGTDGLPHQMDSEVKTGSYDQKSHIVYEYNIDVKIEKPVP